MTDEVSVQVGHAWRAKNPTRYARAQSVTNTVRTALSNGTLKRASTCEGCGLTGVFTEPAHADYDQPLAVRWLCRSCHRRWDLRSPKTLATVVAGEVEPMQRSDVGIRIMQRLAELDRPMRWLAKQLSKDPSTVSRWVDGSREINLRQLREIALVLHRTPGWLLGEPEVSHADDDSISA